MKSKTFSFSIFLCLGLLSVVFLMTGCVTTDSTPKPPRERLSSMPQNLPASWEAQSRMGGMPMSY
jgi:hypothetical protein